MIPPIRLNKCWSLMAIVSLLCWVTSAVTAPGGDETKWIRAKRQHFLGVIIESALTGQHHGFGHRPPFYGYGSNSQEQPQRHWWIPKWWPNNNKQSERKSRPSDDESQQHVLQHGHR